MVTTVHDEVDISNKAGDGHDLLRGSSFEERKKGIYEQCSPDDVRLKLWIVIKGLVGMCGSEVENLAQSH